MTETIDTIMDAASPQIFKGKLGKFRQRVLDYAEKTGQPLSVLVRQAQQGEIKLGAVNDEAAPQHEDPLAVDIMRYFFLDMALRAYIGARMLEQAAHQAMHPEDGTVPFHKKLLEDQSRQAKGYQEVVRIFSDLVTELEGPAVAKAAISDFIREVDDRLGFSQGRS